MRYYRCKCGNAESWGSIGPFRCARCTKCGSDLAEGPKCHSEPLAHSMRREEVEVETDAGKVRVGQLSRCHFCMRTLAEIRALGQPIVYWDEPAERERRAKEDEDLKKLIQKWDSTFTDSP